MVAWTVFFLWRLMLFVGESSGMENSARKGGAGVICVANSGKALRGDPFRP